MSAHGGLALGQLHEHGQVPPGAAPRIACAATRTGVPLLPSTCTSLRFSSAPAPPPPAAAACMCNQLSLDMLAAKPYIQFQVIEISAAPVSMRSSASPSKPEPFGPSTAAKQPNSRSGGCAASKKAACSSASSCAARSRLARCRASCGMRWQWLCVQGYCVMCNIIDPATRALQ